MTYIHEFLNGLFPGIPSEKYFPIIPFNFFDLKSFWWEFCLVYFAAALLVYLRRSNRQETLLQSVFPARIFLTRSFLLDLTNFVFAATFSFFLFGWVSTQLIEGISTGVAWLQARAPQPYQPPEFLWPHMLLYTGLVLVAQEFFGYWLHRFQHRNRFLWEFHKVHHTATALSFFSGSRLHPVDSVLVAVSFAVGSGVVTLAFGLVFGDQLALALVLGINLFRYYFRLLGVIFAHHSHLWLRWGPALDRIILCPAYHQIHHSRDPRHFGKNLAAWLTVYDWMFGTQCLPQKHETLSYGVSEEIDKEYTTLRALYLLPFKKCYELVVRRPAGTQVPATPTAPALAPDRAI